MKRITTTVFATFIACGLAVAEDKAKEQYKVEGTDPVTGQKVKGKYKAKAEADGDYKEESKVKVGDKKYKSKTKVDDGKLEKHKTEIK